MTICGSNCIWGWRRTLVAVKPGTLMNDFSIADINVETVGDPNAACQKLTKSATESNRIAADAESCVSLAVVVDRLLRSTILKHVRKSRFP